jgi:hypothetical protein
MDRLSILFRPIRLAESGQSLSPRPSSLDRSWPETGGGRFPCGVLNYGKKGLELHS